MSDYILEYAIKPILTLVLIILGIFLIMLPFITINLSWLVITNELLELKYFFIFFGGLFVIIGIFAFFKIFYFSNSNIEQKNFSTCNTCEKVLCFTDDKRTVILNIFKPHMYFPLEFNFINLVSNVQGNISSKNTACDTNVFPYVENMQFIRDYGYKFDGKNMLSIHAKQYFPSGKESRTFIFAINPTNKPVISSEHSDRYNPMFFFAYGKRKTHECGDGYTNHDKSFGMFWGDPQPDDRISSDYLGGKVRLFFYCEHCIEDRTSQNCDSIGLSDIEELNKWYIFAISYNGSEIKVYKNGILIHKQNYDLCTSETVYLNIGGFVHHDEDGAIIARGLGYSMHGYIREFMMFRRVLNNDKIKDLTNEINKLLE